MVLLLESWGGATSSRRGKFCFADSLIKVWDGGETRGITVDDKLRLAIDRSRSLISVIVRGDWKLVAEQF